MFKTCPITAALFVVTWSFVRLKPPVTIALSVIRSLVNEKWIRTFKLSRSVWTKCDIEICEWNKRSIKQRRSDNGAFLILKTSKSCKFNVFRLYFEKIINLHKGKFSFIIHIIIWYKIRNSDANILFKEDITKISFISLPKLH